MTGTVRGVPTQLRPPKRVPDSFDTLRRATADGKKEAESSRRFGSGDGRRSPRSGESTSRSNIVSLRSRFLWLRTKREFAVMNFRYTNVGSRNQPSMSTIAGGNELDCGAARISWRSPLAGLA